MFHRRAPACPSRKQSRIPLWDNVLTFPLRWGPVNKPMTPEVRIIPLFKLHFPQPLLSFPSPVPKPRWRSRLIGHEPLIDRQDFAIRAL
jgi:hypothetical protein